MMKRILGTLFAAFGIMIAFSVCAYGDGWTKENNQWVYYQNGSKVYNEWKSGADGAYYYLDFYGNMAVSGFVDGERYVDSDGKMVTNTWRQIDGAWYFFDTNGKMIRDRSRQINDLTYFFDGDGHMQTGWVSSGSEWYYCDPSSGRMLTSTWRQLEPAADMGYDISESGTADGDGTYWYYFLATGRMVRAVSGDYTEQSIDGGRYAFDAYGRMVTGWIKLNDTVPVISGYKYFNDVKSIGTYGAAHVGWLSAYPPEGADLGSEVQWYYFDSVGRPYHGTDVTSNDNDETLQAKFKRLQKNGVTKTYLFNELGNPVYGLRKVAKTNGTVTSMYFGTKYESCLQLGEKLITDAEGNKWTFNFDHSGYGYNGVKNNKLYYMGMLQKAVDDTYAYYTVNGETWLVSKSGSIVKNHNSKKDPYDVEYRSDEKGHRDGGNAGESELLEPVFHVSEY